MIVIDVGCIRHGGEESLSKLQRRFNPSLLFGFDPDPELAEGVTRLEATTIVTRRIAAWVTNGTVKFEWDGVTSGVPKIANGNAADVRCFDIAQWLETLPAGDTVLKLDCEGGEYPILRKIRRLGADRRLALVLVEWHSEEMAHGWMTDRPALRCEVEEWPA